MADVQVEDGHVRIANALFEALFRLRIPGRHKDVIACVIRLTYGFNKTRDTIAYSQIADQTGLHVRDVRRSMSDLIEWKILDGKSNGPRRPLTWALVKDFDRWSPAKSGDAKRHAARGKGTPQSEGHGTPQPSEGEKITSEGCLSHDTEGCLSPTPKTERQDQRQGGAEAPDPPSPKLSPRLVAQLIAMRPHGVLHTEAEVQAWFGRVYPQMLARRIKRPSRAAAKWFPNVRPGEVAEAVAWQKRCRIRDRAAELKAEAEARPPQQFTAEQIERAANALRTVS